MNSYPDGDIGDPFEDIQFFVQDNKLMKQEGAEASASEFLDNVSALQFTYFDTNNVAISNPAASHATISRVRIVLTAQAPGSTPIVFESAAYLRQR